MLDGKTNTSWGDRNRAITRIPAPIRDVVPSDKFQGGMNEIERTTS
jgi:hypothetical protein